MTFKLKKMTKIKNKCSLARTVFSFLAFFQLPNKTYFSKAHIQCQSSEWCLGPQRVAFQRLLHILLLIILCKFLRGIFGAGADLSKIAVRSRKLFVERKLFMVEHRSSKPAICLGSDGCAVAERFVATGATKWAPFTPNFA